MPLTSEVQEQLGRSLYEALRARTTLPPITQTHPDVTVEDAYRISRAMLALRMERDGERIVGKKIGVTSSAVQEMLGVFQPDFGFLTDAMAFADGAEIPASSTLISPRAEGEIAFRLKHTLSGTDNTASTVLEAIECFMPCFEIVDSRIANWQIAIQDTVSDNASCGVYVLGETQLDPAGVDFAAIQIDLYKNDEPLSSGLGSAVQGNPLAAVAWLANTLGGFGINLEAGEIILSGSVVPLEPVEPGDKLRLEMTGPGIAPSSSTCSFS